MTTSKVGPTSCGGGEIASRGSTVVPYRAVPLSTRQIVATVISLAIFSFLYLSYAQHHQVVFYTMTGLVGVYILFVYTSGIFAVLYMVVVDYDLDKIRAADQLASECESSI